jgi:hypothetical protein
VPVVCKASFLSQYRTRDGNGSTSVLLLQAMLLAAAKVSKSARLLHSLTSIRVTGSNLPLSEKTPLQTHLVDIFHEGPCTIRLPKAAGVFFVQYVELMKIMGQIFSTYYSVSSRVLEGQPDSRLQYDSQLTAWLQQRPREMVWPNSRHELWASMLNLHYCYGPPFLQQSMSNTTMKRRGMPP